MKANVRNYAPRIALGKILVHGEVRSAVVMDDILTAVSRHLIGDWGELSTNDWNVNDMAVVQGREVLSMYYSGAGVRFFVLTNAQRTETLITTI